jgi:hypothetical protein
MKRRAIAAIPVLLAVSIWPAICTFASIDLSYDPGPGITTKAFNGPPGLFQLVKHDEDDNDQREHPHHNKHHGQHQFCGPYFTSGSGPYFRDYYSADNYANVPPGLRKHLLKTGHLPPGLEKKYERTGQLPPGLQKRLECGQTVPAGLWPYFYPVPDVAYQRVGPLPAESKL